MTEEQIKAKAKEQFPNDEFKQQAIINAINWATKELQEEIKKTQHLADVRCDQAVENYQKWHVTNREKIDLEIKVEELEKQIENMKCCGNCTHCKYDQNEESNEYCEKHQQIVNVAIRPCIEWELAE